MLRFFYWFVEGTNRIIPIERANPHKWFSFPHKRESFAHKSREIAHKEA